MNDGKLKVEPRAIDTIHPYPNNAKIHDEYQIIKLAQSIKEHGWDQPIVVDGGGVIIKGHGRRLAALKLGYAQVPVVVRDDLSEAQVKAARLADNRVAEGEYDTVLLQNELAELADTDELLNTGFDDRELGFLTEDIGDLDDAAFMRDLNESVDEQTQRQEQIINDAKQAEVLLTDVFGFKKLPATAQKDVAALVGLIEQATGQEGAAALATFAQAPERYVGASA